MKIAPPLVRGWRAGLLWLGFWTVVGILMFAYQYLDVVVRERSEPFYETLIEEMTGGYATGLLSLGVIRLARILQANDISVSRSVLIHAFVAPVYSALHTTLLWTSRVAVWGILGFGSYNYGRMPVRYFMEAGQDLLDYFVLASLIHLVLYYRSTQQRAVRMAQLEQELTNARLRVLESKLRPHFLFNALNTVSSVMYRDVAAADRVLAQLGDLLRSSLKSDDTHEVTVEEEFATLDLYLSIMRARFGERLVVDIAVDPAVRDAKVPHFVLQPLVENALEHGNSGKDAQTHVTVTARRAGSSLVLTVTDSGRGLPHGELPLGVGLGTTAARLEHMYPGSHDFHMSNGGTGCKVEITIPFHTDRD